ncbi:P-loop containing nucleoside triphosphate hydrolase protein [Xylariaceae sp. FL1651]|nr:P-loop containing nucleoside triphosphate hydrolase protein [Xylariaceae sp. FL1651]
MSSMILSEEESRYFRAILSWEPSQAEIGANRKPSLPERPLAGEFRIMILGSKGCGKTAILTSLCGGSFIGEGRPPNPDYEHGCRHKIQIGEQTYMIDALELAPNQLPREQYLRHAVAITEAAVLMYDIRSRDSFALIQQMHRRIQEALAVDKRQHYGLILVGNKADANKENKDGDRRMVTEAEGYRLAGSLGGGTTRCAFHETSARTGENVDRVFMQLGSELLRLRWLKQQRQEQADDFARSKAMGGGNGRRINGSQKRAAKWRVWARPWFRRSSEEGARKAAFA